jgi:hypothetical protein
MQYTLELHVYLFGVQRTVLSTAVSLVSLLSFVLAADLQRHSLYIKTTPLKAL